MNIYKALKTIAGNKLPYPAKLLGLATLKQSVTKN